MNDGRPIAIIGAGFAGLVAAVELRKAGLPVVVLEAGPEVGGLARSFKDEQGFSFDFGAHFITNRLAAELGVADKCRTVRYYGESVWLDGKAFGYPFGLLRRTDFLASAVRHKLGSLGRHSAVKTARDVFVADYGSALTDSVAAPLLEAWSGASANELAPAVADKIATSIPKTVWLRLAARATRRAVAIGYCREKPESARVWHVYPEGGLGLLVDHLANQVADSIRTNSRVEAISVERGRVVGISVNGEQMRVGAVLSTAPVNVLPRIVLGTSKLDALAGFEYRPMVFVNFRLEGRNLLPNVVTWTPERRFPFFRLTEAPTSMPWLAPEGKTMITADIGCEVDDEVWRLDDQSLYQLCKAGLTELVADFEARHIGFQTLRTKLAYPKFLLRYENDRQALSQGTGIEGLILIGRNGQFDHLLMEDLYWRTLRTVRHAFSDNVDARP